MALDTNFNVNPFFDDFDEDKKFLRMLFKPGFAVQARELTQLQTILQNQVDRFGQHIFVNGSRVVGCQSFIQDATYINLTSTFATTDVVANNFIGQTILSINDSKRAEVIRVFEADEGTNEPITLMVKQLYGDPFTASETIKTNEISPVFANTSGVGTGQIFSVNEGVFFYDGFFIKNSPQTIALTKYSNNSANVKVGFEITESIVSSTSDTSLLDPAQDASNYQAPGADRFKIDLVLASRDVTSNDTVQFIELSRVEKALLVQDNKYPIYSILEDTLARRTFDESGNYTVRTFKISLENNAANSAQTDVILSPGKAYVYGYEIETISPTTITVDKPRESTSVANKRLNADFGNFIYTKNHHNTFPINALLTANVHCVSNASINLTSAASISNTNIGTVRIKAIEFDSASNTQNSQTYGYRTFIFDTNIGSITGNVNTATSSSITIGNTVAGYIYTNVTNAYAGAKLRIISGFGSDEQPKIITAFNATTQTITLADTFATVPNSQSIFSIDFEFNDGEAITIHNGTSCVSALDVADQSKDFATEYDDVVITDTALEPLIFDIGQKYIKEDSISDFIYSYRRLYSSVSFTSNSASISVNDAATENFASGSTTTQQLENYHIVCTTADGSYAIGDIVSSDRISVTNDGTSTVTLTVANSHSMSANIIATIDTQGQIRKDKTYVLANAAVQITGGQSINTNGVIVYSDDGQTTIEANNVIKTPDVNQSLFVSDVEDLIQVLDFNGSAVANTGYVDVTSRYILDNGQRDSFYDHASIKLKPGNTPPNGPLVVRYNRYTSSSGAGFFTVDSYPTYETIPEYASPTTGLVYQLRDSIDFRPVRKDATTALGTTVSFNTTSVGTKIPQNGSSIDLDFEYYLPRVDKVILNKDRTFEVVQGVSSLTPQEPKDKDNGMTLYLLVNPAYVSISSDIDVRYIENKRYTMRDIGKLEKRIDNLEYYTSLSLLEQDTLNKQDLTILDSTNLPRFKNGILTDSFKGHSVAAVTSPDYFASIDPVVKELRPSFNISSHLLTFDANSSSNFAKSGPIINAAGTSVPFIDQPIASRFINVNPFNVVNYIGKIALDPPSDVWVDTERKPDVTVNIGGDQDAWDRILTASGASAFQLEWSSWETKWNGTSTTSTDRIFEQTFAHGIPRRILEVTTTSQQIGQSRTGITSQVTVGTIKESIGDRVIDISVIPYMRNRNVLFVANDFKPDTTLFSFFDSLPVENFVARANKIILNESNLSYRTEIGNPEEITIVNNGTSTTNATGLIVSTSNNEAFLVSLTPTSALNAASMNLVGSSTGTTSRIAAYEHYTGIVQSATSSTIVLRQDASGARNEQFYANTSNNSTVFIVAGTGAGQSATISSYNAGTRTITISGTWATTPSTNSIYSIGRLESNRSGSTSGIFFIPTATFRTGEKRFRLINNSTGDLGSSSTNGDASFYAQGTLQVKEQIFASTLAPQIQRASVTEERVITETTGTLNTGRVVGYWDPLAQTFLVSPANYPQGLFVDKVRFCFKSKDSSVPITCQIRPATNGYPSSSVVYPYATVSLTPDKVKITDSPDLDDSAKFTDFRFDAPIYLQPGEHSFVLLANSNKYEVFIAEIGKLDLVNGKQISEQAYGGSLFLSQNGSTWTADQNSDMMFRLFRQEFSKDTVTCHFTVNHPSSNTPFDLMHLTTGEIVVANTSAVYTFSSEKATGGLTGFKSVIPFVSLLMDDGNGRRVLNPATGNNTMNLKVTMATSDSSITPFLDANRFSVITVENIINNLPLLNTGFVITNGGSGYTGNTSVTITGGKGSGANAFAVVSSGNVTSIIIDNAGSGYTTSPTIVVAQPPVPSGNVVASATYNGEDQRSGGNARARYITRKVVLADGFDSGDLRVYLTAYKPSGANIHVYYKILSKSDPEIFDNKKYQLMTQLDNANFVSANEGDYREMSFAPGVNGIANNSVSYTTDNSAFSTFRTFAIKIVMTGTSTIEVPKIRDLRTIALPAG